MSYSDTAKKLRLPLGFLFGGVYLALVRPTRLTLVAGALVALAGVGVRAWAAGHIRKNARLATTGPYAHTRNPLYFGSFLIAAGFGIAAHWSVLLLVVTGFALIYAPTMEQERSNIRERFPEDFARYEQNVPHFFPRVRPWREAGDAPGDRFSFELYMRHAEWKALLVYVAAVIWLTYRSLPGR